MNIRGTSLLVIAIVFSLTTTVISQSLGTPGIIGLFWGILPKKEFRILFLLNLISLGWGLIVMQNFLSSTYSGMNIQNISGSTNNNYLPDNTQSGNIQVSSSGISATIENIILGIIKLPQTVKNIFPTSINYIGEFIGAGLYSALVFFGLFAVVAGLFISLAISIIYISNYYLLRSLLYPYLPNIVTVSNGQYPMEYGNIMATTGLSLYVIYFLGSIVLTHLLLKRIGFYSRVRGLV